MRFAIAPYILILMLIWMIPAYAQQDGEKSVENILKKADAAQAMAIANEWKWSKKGIQSYVTSREVVFKFPDGKVEKVPLPAEKFLVAVAPYIKRTHQ